MLTRIRLLWLAAGASMTPFLIHPCIEHLAAVGVALGLVAVSTRKQHCCKKDHKEKDSE